MTQRQKRDAEAIGVKRETASANEKTRFVMTALGFETASAPIPPRSDIPPASHSEPRSGEESRFLGGFRDCFAKRKNEARRDSAQRKNEVYSDEVRGGREFRIFYPQRRKLRETIPHFHKVYKERENRNSLQTTCILRMDEAGSIGKVRDVKGVTRKI